MDVEASAAAGDSRGEAVSHEAVIEAVIEAVDGVITPLTRSKVVFLLAWTFLIVQRMIALAAVATLNFMVDLVSKGGYEAWDRTRQDGQASCLV